MHRNVVKNGVQGGNTLSHLITTELVRRPGQQSFNKRTKLAESKAGRKRLALSGQAQEWGSKIARLPKLRPSVKPKTGRHLSKRFSLAFRSSMTRILDTESLM